jgi:hypothetical protein
MSRTPEVALPRCSLALAVLVGGVLALVVPPLLTAPADPVSSAVAILAAALVGLVGLGVRGLGWSARLARPALGSDDAPTLVLTGRVTDPAHHLARPRAPGLVA